MSHQPRLNAVLSASLLAGALVLSWSSVASGDDGFQVQVLKTWTETAHGHKKDGHYLQSKVREVGSGREYVLYCWEPKPKDQESRCYSLRKGETYTARREKRSTYVSIPLNGASLWAEYIEAENGWKL